MIELWIAALDRPLSGVETQMLTAALPERRRERLERLREETWRREPLCAYGLLLRALQNRFGWQTLPTLEYSSSGKPHFPDWPDVHFSISHTDGAVMVGLADREIGVDIEKIRPVKEVVLRRFDCGGEAAFFETWVRREARAKRLGTPVELGTESPLLPGEQIVYPEGVFRGYAACAVWMEEEKAVLHCLTLKEILEEHKA